MTLTFAFKDVKGNEARASCTVDILDEAVISNVKPAQGAQTGAESGRRSPRRSRTLVFPSVIMTVNGAEVNAAYADGKVTYTPAADMADGKVTVTVTVKRADKKETSKTWSFTIGEATFQRYFGQLHPTRSIPTALARWTAHWRMSRRCLTMRTLTSSHSPTIPTTSTARITPNVEAAL